MLQHRNFLIEIFITIDILNPKDNTNRGIFFRVLILIVVSCLFLNFRQCYLTAEGFSFQMSFYARLPCYVLIIVTGLFLNGFSIS